MPLVVQLYEPVDREKTWSAENGYDPVSAVKVAKEWVRRVLV